MQILVKKLTGQTIIIDDVNIDDTVLSVKSKIADLEEIPENLQRLIFQGRQLDDDLPLCDCSSPSGQPIEDGSILYLVVRFRPENTTEIFVRTMTFGINDKFVLRSTRDKVQRVKNAIELRQGISSNQQRLIFDGRELEDDDRSLSDYDIKSGDTLSLVVRLKEESQSALPYMETRILVTTEKGTSVTIEGICGSDTIRTLKTKLSIAAGMPVAEQRLKFESWVLEKDDSTLLDYDIPKDATLHLTSWESALYKVKDCGIELKNMDMFVRAKKEIVLAAVTRRGLALAHASVTLRGDREIVLTAVDQNAAALQYAADYLKDDREIVLRAVSQNASLLEFASPTLRNDREVVLTAVSQNSISLQFASQTLRGDRLVVVTAVKQNSAALQYASEALRNDREVILTSFGQNSFALQYATEAWKDDREFALEIVQRDGNALQYFSSNIQGDEEVAISAIEENVVALKWASNKLKNERDFRVKVVHLNDSAYQYLDLYYHKQADKEFALEAIAKKASLLAVMPRILLAMDAFILQVVAQNGLALKYAPDWAKRKKAVVLTAVGQNGLALAYADDSMRNDKEIVLTAVALDGRALEFTNLRNDRDTVLEAVRRNPNALTSVPPHLKSDREVLEAPTKFEASQALIRQREAMAADRSNAVVWDRLVAEWSQASAWENANDQGTGAHSAKEMSLEIVKQNRQAFRYAPRSLRADKDVVLAAVTRNHEMLKFALGGLNQDHDCWLAAGLWTKEQQQQKKQAAEESTVKQIALSTKFSLNERSNSSVTRFTKLLNEHSFFRDGSFTIYSPNAFSKDTCDPQWTRMTWPCRGTFETYQKRDSNLKTGTPQTSSCWRYSFRWHLEKAAKTNGFMLQVVDLDGNPGLFEKSPSAYTLGEGQKIESKMAAETGTKIFRIYRPRTITATNGQFLQDFRPHHIHVLASLVKEWYKDQCIDMKDRDINCTENMST